MMLCDIMRFVAKKQKNDDPRSRAELIAVRLESLLRLSIHARVLLGVCLLSQSQLLALVVGRALGLASLLQSLNNILVLPANLVAQTTDGAELAAGLQSEDTESLGNNDLLLLVVRGRDTLEDLKSLQSSSTSGSLVRNHSTDGLVEDS